jgi:hypothetical protein
LLWAWLLWASDLESFRQYDQDNTFRSSLSHFFIWFNYHLILLVAWPLAHSLISTMAQCKYSIVHSGHMVPLAAKPSLAFRLCLVPRSPFLATFILSSSQITPCLEPTLSTLLKSVSSISWLLLELIWKSLHVRPSHMQHSFLFLFCSIMLASRSIMKSQFEYLHTMNKLHICDNHWCSSNHVSFVIFTTYLTLQQIWIRLVFACHLLYFLAQTRKYPHNHNKYVSPLITLLFNSSKNT